MTQDQTGVLYIVSTPIGNLKDITLRAIEVLKTVDFICAEDTRHSSLLLSHYEVKTKVFSFHNYNETQKTNKILKKLSQGESVALIRDAGTPLISDPGYFLVKEAKLNNIKVVPVPGASALIAALSVSGLPTDSFIFEGFLSAKSKQRQDKLSCLLNETKTTIFYESPHRILDSLIDMQKVLGGEREIVIAREITKVFETIKDGSIDEIIEFVKADANQQKGEFVVLIKGTAVNQDATDEKIISILNLLLQDLPVKKAAEITAKITGARKNHVYSEALKIKGQG